jgi:hypothetical protein
VSKEFWEALRKQAESNARLRASFGKLTTAKLIALDLSLKFTPDQGHEKTKETLLWLALNDPERLRKVADALLWLKRGEPRSVKCPRGRDLIAAYEACQSFPPTFSEIKQRFIAKFGKAKWNGADEDDPASGDYSARKTLRAIGLPWRKTKSGRPKGSKAQRITK